MTISGLAVEKELEAFRRRHGVPAVGAALVTGDGATTIRVVGTVRRGGDEPVTPEDRWHIGSCAKAVTAVVYARLVEAGATTWEAPLGGFFPDLGPDPGWMDRTVAEALTCQAGIPANPSRSAMAAAYRDSRPVTEQRLEATRGALAAPPGAPGRFVYSNLGYVVVGAVIDRVAAMPFEAALQGLVLDPLGMVSAGFGPPPRIHGHGGRVRLGGLVVGRRGPVSPEDARGDNPPLLTPAGRLHLTLEDWTRFHLLVLNGGNHLLDPLTVDRLLAMPPGGRMAMGWAPTSQLDGVLVGMQGSNTMWSASALVADDRSATAMAIANDGRTRILTQTAYLAHRLLSA